MFPGVPIAWHCRKCCNVCNNKDYTKGLPDPCVFNVVYTILTEPEKLKSTYLISKRLCGWLLSNTSHVWREWGLSLQPGLHHHIALSLINQGLPVQDVAGVTGGAQVPYGDHMIPQGHIPDLPNKGLFGIKLSPKWILLLSQDDSCIFSQSVPSPQALPPHGPAVHPEFSNPRDRLPADTEMDRAITGLGDLESDLSVSDVQFVLSHFADKEKQLIVSRLSAVGEEAVGASEVCEGFQAQSETPQRLPHPGDQGHVGCVWLFRENKHLPSQVCGGEKKKKAVWQEVCSSLVWFSLTADHGLLLDRVYSAFTRCL